jgi:hypothetical protein
MACAVNVHRAVLQVDVLPSQLAQLARPGVEVDKKGDDATPLQRHLRAPDETLKLGRIEVLLCRRCPSFRTRDVT